MSKRISTAWMGEIKTRLSDSPSLEEFKVDEIISFNPSAQWLVWFLSKIKKPFKVINLGAGVKRITTDVQTCSRCNGTGKERL